ncbi:hypothetical protein JCM11641_001183 [Rhodosporidiobolus odoratus]
MFSDGDAYYDSDEGFIGPSDDEEEEEEDSWQSEDDGTRSTGSQLTLATARNDLDAFRLTWSAEVDHKFDRQRRVQAFRPTSAVHHVLLNPDLADLILSQPSLTPADLGSLSLSCSILCGAAQRQLFGTLRIGTFRQADELKVALQENPNLHSLFRQVEISLGDFAASLTDVGLVAAKMEEKRRQEDEVPSEYFYAPDGSTLELRPWQAALKHPRSALPPDGNKAAALRRLSHLDWAIQQLEAEEKATAAATETKPREVGQPALIEVSRLLSAALSRWPFVATAQEDLAPVALLNSLASAAGELTLSSPLSHFVPTLMSSLSNTSNIRTLRILARETGHQSLRRFDNSNLAPPPRRRAAIGVAVAVANRPGPEEGELPPPFESALFTPPAAVNLRKDGRGIEGSWAGIERLELEGIVLRQSEALEQSVLQEPRVEPEGWKLSQLEMRWTMVYPPGRRLSTGGLSVHFTETDDLVELWRETHTLPSPTILAQLDLFTFLNLSAPSHTLTSLILVDVDGLSPSSIYRAIQASGSSLSHLTLENVNLGLSAHRPDPVDLPFFTTSHIFHLSPSPPRQPTAEERNFSKLEASARLLPHSTVLQPSPSLAEALYRCAALRSLRLWSSLSHIRTSPYPPAILDALLAAKPPLRDLNWKVGVQGPGWQAGLISKQGWFKFADKLEELARWDSVVVSECSVSVGLRREEL